MIDLFNSDHFMPWLLVRNFVFRIIDQLHNIEQVNIYLTQNEVGSSYNAL